jgi:hypothetical protein
MPSSATHGPDAAHNRRDHGIVAFRNAGSVPSVVEDDLPFSRPHWMVGATGPSLTSEQFQMATDTLARPSRSAAVRPVRAIHAR